MFKNYLKIAFKVLLRRKMFTFISLFGICFTLTILLAATAVYTSMVITNPVEKKLSKTLFINQVTFKNKKTSSMSSGSAMPYFIESSVKLLENIELVAFCSRGCENQTTYVKNERIDIDTKQTDENFFSLISLTFMEGRPYTKDEIERHQKVAVICKSLANRYFGEAKALGKSITINNETYRIIGVVEDVPKLYQTAYAEIWKPYNYASYMNEVQHKMYDSWAYLVMVLPNGKSDIKIIRKQFAQRISWLKPLDNYETITSEMKSSFDLTFGNLIYAYNLDENQIHQKRIIIIIVVLLLFLMIPLLNLTNLTVSRIFERSSEIGVRKAFGATKRQMIGQFVCENLVVTIFGGIFGFFGAWFLLKGINASGIMEIGSIRFSYSILFYGLLDILAFGIISGLYPAINMSKLHIVDILKGGNK